MPPLDPTWRVRRAMATATMAFCMTMIAASAFLALPVEVAKSLISSGFLALTAIPSIYSLAAVADDHSKRITATLSAVSAAPKAQES